MKHCFTLAGLLLMLTNLHAQVSIQKNANVFLQRGAELNIEGDLSSLDNISGDGTVVLQGKVRQQLDMRGFALQHLLIDGKTGVSMISPMAIQEKLVMRNGFLECGNYDLVFHNAAVAEEGSEHSFIETNGTGSIFKQAGLALDQFNFPTGRGGEYAPISVQTQGGAPQASIDIRLNAFTGAHGQMTGEGLYYSWTVHTSGLKGKFTTVAKYGKVNGAEKNLHGCYWDGAQWQDHFSRINTGARAIITTLPATGGEIYAISGGYAGAPAQNSLSLSPDPVINTAHVKINSASDERAVLTIRDMNGEKIISRTINLHQGPNQVTIDLTGRSRGNYILQKINDKEITSIQFSLL